MYYEASLCLAGVHLIPPTAWYKILFLGTPLYCKKKLYKMNQVKVSERLWIDGMNQTTDISADCTKSSRLHCTGHLHFPASSFLITSELDTNPGPLVRPQHAISTSGMMSRLGALTDYLQPSADHRGITFIHHTMPMQWVVRHHLINRSYWVQNVDV